MSVTIGTTTTRYALNNQQERRSFYANGRFWVFYGDGTDLVYRSSTDGSTWSDPTVLVAGAGGIGTASSPVWFDGTYLHHTRLADDVIYYRRGTPDADGGITWSEDEQTVFDGSAGIAGLCVDSEGYPWIGYASTSPYKGYVIKSSTNDGTWTTAAGFPYLLKAALTYPFVVPLTEGKVYAIESTHDAAIYGRLWDGDSWGDAETITTSLTEYAWSKCAVNVLDDVHLVFNDDVNDHIIYVKRTYGVGWGSEETVQASVTADSYPILSVDGDAILYCFWIGSPTADHVYYKKNVAGVWDTNPTDWIDESADGIVNNNYLTGYYGAYEGYIVLVYCNKDEPLMDVRHNYLSGLTPFPYVPPVPRVNPLISREVVSRTVIRRPRIR